MNNLYSNVVQISDVCQRRPSRNRAAQAVCSRRKDPLPACAAVQLEQQW